MSFNIVLNSSNVSNNNTNTQLTYNFIQGGIQIPPGSEICVSQIVLPYAFFNISQYYNNLSFSYYFPYGNSEKLYTVVFQPGFYSVSGIQNYLELYMISQNQYFINTTTNKNLFFISIVQNQVYYANELVLSPIPTSLSDCNSLYPQSLGSWSEPEPNGFNYNDSVDYGYPNTSYTPQIVILNSNNFGKVIGFIPGTYPLTQQTTLQNILSNQTPNATPVNSLIITCSLINSPTLPSNIVDSFPITDTSFGSNIVYSPYFDRYVECVPGHYKSISFQILDQNFNTIYSLDPNLLITILIRLKK